MMGVARRGLGLSPSVHTSNVYSRTLGAVIVIELVVVVVFSSVQSCILGRC